MSSQSDRNQLMDAEEIDWGFRSTPQQHLLPKGRVLDLERGKTLGGSSAINYNLWVHGAPQDFDRWETQYGCTGWSLRLPSEP